MRLHNTLSRCLVALGLCGCSQRAQRDAGAWVRGLDVSLPREVGAPVDVPHTTQGRGASGPWRTLGAGAFAVSPGVWLGDGVYSVMAEPTEDLRRAELRWLRWSEAGGEVIARKEVRGMIPGAALALDPRGPGLTVQWLPAGDGGQSPREQDLMAQSFVGEERDAAASAETTRASAWLRAVSARRARVGAEEPAPPADGPGASVRSELRGGSVVVHVDGIEVTRGSDLLGYERAVGAAARASVRWVGLSRGRCADARIELYKVVDGSSSLRASFPIGAEIGVRWIALDVHPDAVVLSWYQDYIPIRVSCDRARTLSNLEAHGLRVALLREP